MHLVKGSSQGTSYGILTGPPASRFLAEALLIEVDEYLVANHIDYVRNVDDYSIFGSSEGECYQGLYLLAERLHKTQGLSLNVAKTRIRTVERFESEFLAPRNHLREIRDTIVRDIMDNNPYQEIDYDSLSDDELRILNLVAEAFVLRRTALNGS
jgi:hypothetical protein